MVYVRLKDKKCIIVDNIKSNTLIVVNVITLIHFRTTVDLVKREKLISLITPVNSEIFT